MPPYNISDVLADNLLMIALSGESPHWSGRPTEASVHRLNQIAQLAFQYSKTSLLLLQVLFLGGGIFTVGCAMQWIPLPFPLVLTIWLLLVGLIFGVTLGSLLHLRQREQQVAIYRFSRYALTQSRLIVVTAAHGRSPLVSWVPLQHLVRLERSQTVEDDGSANLTFHMVGGASPFNSRFLGKRKRQDEPIWYDRKTIEAFVVAGGSSCLTRPHYRNGEKPCQWPFQP